MAERESVVLEPLPIQPGSSEHQEICRWPYHDTYVTRLLQNDITLRVNLGGAQIWVYRNQAREFVGFGTIDICDDYEYLTEGNLHMYIPLLAVKPNLQRCGYGTSIVQHLIDEATVKAHETFDIHHLLFLDVYENNQKAIQLYERSGFVKISDEPEFDELERQSYFVMAKNISVAQN